MEKILSATALTPLGALASFGSGNGSRQSAAGAKGAAGRRKASAGQLRYEKGRGARIANVGGRGRNARKAAVDEYNRVVNARPTKRELAAARERLRAATNLY